MTQSTVTNIERISSGSEMPSMPTWYRALITSIHGSFAMNCSLLEWSKLKSAMIPMPTPRVASVVTSATTLAAVSSAFGSRRMMASPTAGRKTASVSAHSWNQFIAFLPRYRSRASQ